MTEWDAADYARISGLQQHPTSRIRSEPFRSSRARTSSAITCAAAANRPGEGDTFRFYQMDITLRA
jgi:hypothetical protein